jgi:membrane-associated phospholipid phosphatase
LVVEFVVPGSVGAWDGRVVNTFANQRTAELTDVSAVGSGLAETITVVVIGLLLAVTLAAKRAWFLLGLVVLSLVMEVTVYLAVTHVVHRQRPIVEQLERLRPGASYPSGHTAAAFALYFSIAAVISFYAASRLTRNFAWAIAALVPLIVAISRVYRGMHHPTDAMAGLFMGAGCVIAALFAVRTAGVVARSRAAAGPDGSEVEGTAVVTGTA